MSGVPLKADIRLMRLNVRKVPIAAVRLSDYAAGVGEQDRGDGNGHFSALSLLRTLNGEKPRGFLWLSEF